MVSSLHGDRCYICRVPLPYLSMTIDHVIPESLEDSPSELARLRAELGLPASFRVNSYENWLPACSPCNSTKRANVFRPSLQVQGWLERAAARADEARALEAQGLSDLKVSRAIGVIRAASEGQTLTPAHLQSLEPLLSAIVDAREAADRTRPVKLTATLELLSDNGLVRVYRGPYGIGGAPSTDTPSSSFVCPTCGFAAWNGARCVYCGQTSDD